MAQQNTRPNIVKILILSFLVSPILFSCSEQETSEAPPPPEITVTQVIQKDVPIYQEFVGQIKGELDIPIRARVSGWIEAIRFQEGRRVEKGQLLYSIDQQPFLADVQQKESALAEAQTAFVKAEADLNRYKPLAEKNAVSKSDLDAAQANFDAAAAYVEAAKAGVMLANINLGYCQIKSPITGIIGKTEAKVGEFVGQYPNPVILNTVSNTENVLVEFFLTESDYLKIAREYMTDNEKHEKKPREKSSLQLILSDGSELPSPGRVDFINREVDPETGSLLIQATFPNNDGLLKPGQYAKVVVEMEVKKDALLVPQRCVMEIQGQHSVYIVNNENKVESRQIVTGDRIGDLWLVTEGLKPGEKVVIDALQKARPGMVVTPAVTEFTSKSNTKD